MIIRTASIAILSFALAGTPGSTEAQTPPGGYRPAPAGDRCHALGPLSIRPLVDSAALGGPEAEAAELILPPGWDSAGRGHRHGRTEILFVISGRLGHVVNDTVHRLGPGEVGIVRPGDRVRHQVLTAEPVRALVVWAPGGELARILSAATAARCPPL